MPKRKRPGYTRDHGSQSTHKAIAAEIAQSRKLLHRALKLAKGFARQKLGKRLKNAEKEGKSAEVERIQREIETLRTLSLEEVVEEHLRKSWGKVKAFVEAGVLTLMPQKGNDGSGDTGSEKSEEVEKARRNVMSGMYNTKVVKEAMEPIMSGMYVATGIPAPGKGKSGSLTGSAIASHGKTATEETQTAEKDSEDKENEGAENDWEGFGSEDERDDAEDPAEELDEDTIARYEDLLGSSDEESFDEDVYRAARPTEPSRQTSYSISPSISRSASPESAISASPPRKVPKTTTKSKAAVVPAKQSTFLPTLMGGYYSGSESSASEIEDLAAPIRKNRPGQKARQAIWEKKYGGGANHIKSGKPSVAEAKGREGKGFKRADSRGRGRGRGRGGERDIGNYRERKPVAPRGTGENAAPLGGKRDDTGPLHPSWAAAKKAKAGEKQATFAGKKVVFN